MRYCDLHCDLLSVLSSFAQWQAGNNQIQVTPSALYEGVFLQTFAIFAANDRATMPEFYRQFTIFSKIAAEVQRRGVKAVLSVENGAFLQGEPENLQKMSNCGVKMLTLTWNGGNGLAGGHGQDVGLTALGREVTERMFFLRMLPDVSHLSQRAFWQVNGLAHGCSKPFLASHSNARALCNHTRNLTDGQIKAIAQRGGVVGVTFYAPFLGGFTPAQHAAYLLQKGGEDVVCIGSDFDGISPMQSFYADCRETAVRLYDDLLACGFTPRQADKAVRQNALRVLAE